MLLNNLKQNLKYSFLPQGDVPRHGSHVHSIDQRHWISPQLCSDGHIRCVKWSHHVRFMLFFLCVVFTSALQIFFPRQLMLCSFLLLRKRFVICWGECIRCVLCEGRRCQSSGTCMMDSSSGGNPKPTWIFVHNFPPMRIAFSFPLYVHSLAFVLPPPAHVFLPRRGGNVVPGQSAARRP